ncbi:MAG: 30S ribosomal protein S6 [Nitrospirae bacterium]|nr:30S ribosomal protein S6 [Nitrospirota bacterium]MBF0542573.1 30S ribosomal protein S6 [Nitrospirota bacterium]
MNYYEHIVIVDSSLDEEAISATEKRTVETIEKAGGEIIKVERWGRRRLSYIINKHENGYYIFFVFKTTGATIKQLDNLYKVLDTVFKYMIIKLGKKEILALLNSLQNKKQEGENAVKPEVQINEAAEEEGE